MIYSSPCSLLFFYWNSSYSNDGHFGLVSCLTFHRTGFRSAFWEVPPTIPSKFPIVYLILPIILLISKNSLKYAFPVHWQQCFLLRLWGHFFCYNFRFLQVALFYLFWLFLWFTHFSSNLWEPPAVCSSLRVGCCESFLCEVLHGVIWLCLIRAGQRQVFESHVWRVWLSTFWKPGRKKGGDLNILCAAVHLLYLLQYWAPAFRSWPQPWSPLGWRQGSASLLRVRRRVRSSFPLAASPSFPPPEVPVVASHWGCPGFCATNLGVLSVCLLYLWPVQDRTFSGLVNYYLFIGPPASRIWLLLPSLFFPLSDWVYSFHCHFSGAWGENRGVQTSILTKTKLLNLSHVYESVFLDMLDILLASQMLIKSYISITFLLNSLSRL